MGLPPSEPGKEEEEEEEEEEASSPFCLTFSFCVWVLLEEYKKIGFLWETTSGSDSVFFISWLHSGYTHVRQSTQAFGTISHIFLFDHQGQLGSCWSFSTAGSYEGVWAASAGQE